MTDVTYDRSPSSDLEQASSDDYDQAPSIASDQARVVDSDQAPSDDSETFSPTERDRLLGVASDNGFRYLLDEQAFITKFRDLSIHFLKGYAEIIVSTLDVRIPRNTSQDQQGIWLDLEDLHTAEDKLRQFSDLLKNIKIDRCSYRVAMGYEDILVNLLNKSRLEHVESSVVDTIETELLERIHPEHGNRKFVLLKLAHAFSMACKDGKSDRLCGFGEGSGDEQSPSCELSPIIANAQALGLSGRLIITVKGTDGLWNDYTLTTESCMNELLSRKHTICSSQLNIIRNHDEGFLQHCKTLTCALEVALSLQSREPCMKLNTISTQNLCLDRLIIQQTCLANSLDDIDFRARVAKRVESKSQFKNVYVIGETGQGKSCTLRALCGDQVEVAQAEPTANITPYTFGTNVVYYDTPGLNDENGRDDRTMSCLLSHVADKMTASSILYVRKDWSRLPKSEQKAIHSYSQVFGKQLKDMIVIVVTSKRSNTLEANVKKQLKKLAHYIGHVSQQRIVYLGTDVDEAVLGRQHLPELELEKLEHVIKSDETHKCINADVLHGLLEDDSEFWDSHQMVERQRQMLRESLPWLPSHVKGNLLPLGSKWKGTRNVSGVLGWFNIIMKTVATFIPNPLLNQIGNLGSYDRSSLSVEVEMAGDKSLEAAKRAENMEELMERIGLEGGMFIHLVTTGEVRERVRTLSRCYVAACPGEKLHESVKEQIVSILYNETVYSELVRAAHAECPKHRSYLN